MLLSCRQCVHTFFQARQDHAEPGGKPVWIIQHFLFHIGRVDPSPFHHFVRIGNRVVIAGPDKDVIQLVFDEVMVEVSSVNERESMLKVGSQTHLFLESSSRGFVRVLSRPRMGATCIRPEAARVILSGRPALE